MTNKALPKSLDKSTKKDTSLVEPSAIQLVIFGANGNLTALKLVPALYNLLLQKKIPQKFKIIGVARRQWSEKEFIKHIKESFQRLHPKTHIDLTVWRQLTNNFRFVSGELNDPQTYKNIQQIFIKSEQQWGLKSDKIFYFSTPAQVYSLILNGLEQSVLKPICQQNTSRVVVEKPFGTNAKSAKELQQQILKVFSEEQIYRVDHVLGKGPMMDIISFRRNNTIMSNLLDKSTVDHIQITYLETIGVQTRGAFYEQTGVTRDFFQNHLLQMLALATMKVPQSLDAMALRKARLEVIKNLSPVKKNDLVVGQYESYRQEDNVNPKSVIPTYVALKTNMQNIGWKGTPVYIRCGKNLHIKFAEIVIVFKDKTEDKLTHPNILTFRIQPQSGIFICLRKGHVDEQTKMKNIILDFCYKRDDAELNDAYENLFHQVILADKTFFVSIEEVLAGWHLVDPINKMIEQEKTITPVIYKDRSLGPQEGKELLTKADRQWYTEEFPQVCRI